MNSIITFYSFKGGVGRSMALANIGYLLAQKGKSVLAVDWDLEAPGLDKYFSGCPGVSIQDASRGGLIDLLTDAYKGNKPDWHDYTSKVGIGEHTIQLITSGRRDEDYPAKVLGFNWHSFFEEAEGGAFIESLRDAWHQEFEISLIDSRTGFTDSSGICTIQLPDILVPVFTTTEESAKGAIDVVDRAQRGRQKLAYDRSRLLVFPLPSRYDGRTQYQEAKAWLHNFAEWFGPCYSDWLPTSITPLQVIERTKLPYIGYFSFGTQMPAAIEGTSDPESLGYAYNVAATIIADDFQQVERLFTLVPDALNEVSREELFIIRMRRALQESQREWRLIDSVTTTAGIGTIEGLEILKGQDDIDIDRDAAGHVRVRLRRVPDIKLQSDLISNDGLRRVFLSLEKTLLGEVVNWTIYFRLAERSTTSGQFAEVVTFSESLDKTLHAAAEEAVRKGLSAFQTEYALGPAADSAKAAMNGEITHEQGAEKIRRMLEA